MGAQDDFFSKAPEMPRTYGVSSTSADDDFIFPKVARALSFVVMVFVAFIGVISCIAALAQGPLACAVAAGITVLSLIFVRIAYELSVVLFKIHDYLREIAKNMKQ